MRVLVNNYSIPFSVQITCSNCSSELELECIDDIKIGYHIENYGGPEDLDRKVKHLEVICLLCRCSVKLSEKDIKKLPNHVIRNLQYKNT